MAACSDTPSAGPPRSARPAPALTRSSQAGAVGRPDAEHVVVLGRQALRAPGEPVARARDLLRLLHGDTGNGNHANIV